MSSAPDSTPPSVPLNRPFRDSSAPSRPVWALNESLESPSTPLPSKCSRHDREDGVCCKDLKDDDERTLIDPDVVRDV